MSGEKYPAFGKIPRWNKTCVLTEKIDGTNGLIAVRVSEDAADVSPGAGVETHRGVIYLQHEDDIYEVRAGSRNRWLTAEQDNYGFFQWVQANAKGLVNLGEGLHYGEWWGLGIQRGYNQQHKRFSLFNAGRWNEDNLPEVPGLGVVPVLQHCTGDFVVEAIAKQRAELLHTGSKAAPGFMRPEGIIVFVAEARQYFKVIFEGDEPKSVIQMRRKANSDAFLAGLQDAA